MNTFKTRALNSFPGNMKSGSCNCLKIKFTNIMNYLEGYKLLAYPDISETKAEGKTSRLLKYLLLANSKGLAGCTL